MTSVAVVVHSRLLNLQIIRGLEDSLGVGLLHLPHLHLLVFSQEQEMIQFLWHWWWTNGLFTASKLISFTPSSLLADTFIRSDLDLLLFFRSPILLMRLFHPIAFDVSIGNKEVLTEFLEAKVSSFELISYKSRSVEVWRQNRTDREGRALLATTTLLSNRYQVTNCSFYF